MKSWVDYWNSDHAIYVNERHKTLHAEAVGRDIARFIRSADAALRLGQPIGRAQRLRQKCALCADAAQVGGSVGHAFHAEDGSVSRLGPQPAAHATVGADRFADRRLVIHIGHGW